ENRIPFFWHNLYRNASRQTIRRHPTKNVNTCFYVPGKLPRNFVRRQAPAGYVWNRPHWYSLTPTDLDNQALIIHVLPPHSSFINDTSIKPVKVSGFSPHRAGRWHKWSGSGNYLQLFCLYFWLLDTRLL